jgi:hypothetical protein
VIYDEPIYGASYSLNTEDSKKIDIKFSKLNPDGTIEIKGEDYNETIPLKTF